MTLSTFKVLDQSESTRKKRVIDTMKKKRVIDTMKKNRVIDTMKTESLCTIIM